MIKPTIRLDVDETDHDRRQRGLSGLTQDESVSANRLRRTDEDLRELGVGGGARDDHIYGLVSQHRREIIGDVDSDHVDCQVRREETTGEIAWRWGARRPDPLIQLHEAAGQRRGCSC